MRVIALALAAALGSACTPGRWQAPVEDRRPPPRAAAPAARPAPVTVRASPEGTYVVKRGDTLYSIALEHGADYRDVAQWNALDDPGRLRAGQVLRMKPPPAQQGVTLGTAPSVGRVESRSLEGQKPAAPEAKPAAREEPKLEAQPLQFTWPAKGKVLAGFAEPRHKGIDIEGRIGDPVIAAAAGRVTYVGSGIPGLGKLVVIRHDQGYITVYAHNKDILVKEQQSVTRGQRIAELGNTDAERPKLHFQIRKGSSAVDPLLYLPKS